MNFFMNVIIFYNLYKYLLINNLCDII